MLTRWIDVSTLAAMLMKQSAPWGFYGRKAELRALSAILRRNRWFFVKVTGRRSIGKAFLVGEALKRSGREKVLYVQVPDSGPAGVLAAVADFYNLFHVPGSRPTDLRSFAQDVARLVRDGWVVALDEFQYFHRRALFDFTSHLQTEVDRLANEASTVSGGLIVLGSIHTEMTALLEDRAAPLFNRITDELDVTHLDIASILEILRTHGRPDPETLLFLWNLFEGVPKFYRDCHEQGVLGAPRRQLLETMFFSSSSPLRNEADNWFLRELRGRYDLVLKFVAAHPGCTNGEIDAHVRSVDPASEPQVGGYIRVLRERFGMVDRLQPIFAKPTSRNGRFYIRDNFLRSWLSSLQTAAAAVHFRPLPELVTEADLRLQEAEGHGFERLVAELYAERSRKALAGFRLTHRVEGFWDKADRSGHPVEIDLVALDDTSRTIRLGTCKRQGDRLIPQLARFSHHIDKFLTLKPEFALWTVERAAIAPTLTPEQRAGIRAAGYIPQDLIDLTGGM